MAEKWISIKSITEYNKSFIFEDLAKDFIDIPEFKDLCTLTEDDFLSAKLDLTHNDSGCVIRGYLRAKVHGTCSICAEDSVIELDHAIDEFEFYPDSELEQDEDDHFEKELEVDTLIFRKDRFGTLEFDILGFLWEIFVISLPIKIVCKEDCKGLCLICGQNLNFGTCECQKDELDPRLAKLREFSPKK